MTPAGRATPPAPDGRQAYFLDIDGTLVRIARRPGAVQVDDALRGVLARARRRSGGALALISGRSLADIDRLFPGTRAAAGQHGIERRTAGRLVTRRRDPVALGGARRRLAEAASRYPGLLLEDKGQSLALHYRLAPSRAGYVRRVMREEVRRVGDRWCLLEGRRVIELRPAGRDKGRAVREFMAEPPFRGRVPVFIGDDLTDEYAFAVVNDLGGISIKVGRGSTAARWRLAGVGAVLGWLEHGIPAPRLSRGAGG